MFYNENQHHYEYNIFSFSPSLLMTSCLGNIQWRWAPTALISCCNSHFLNDSCFSRHWLFNPHFTSFESSLLFPLTSLGSSLQFQARSCVTSRSRARLYSFCFQILFAFLSLFFSLSREKVGDGIRSPLLRISSCLLTLKTTVPWP